METITKVEIEDIDSAVAVLTGDGDGAWLDGAIGRDTIVSSSFWLNEMKQFDYNYYISYMAGDDEEEDEDFIESDNLSDLALDAIRAGVAQKLGITAKHVAPQRDEGLKHVGDFVEKVIDNMLISPPAPTAPALPARALAFGQPQIVEGRGQWDNTRYFVADEDEK